MPFQHALIVRLQGSQMGDERIYSIEKSFLSEDLKEGNYRPACNTPVRCHFTGKLIVTKVHAGWV